MDHKLKLRAEELTDNPAARVPILLALDVSGSMRGEKIDALNRALGCFLQSLQADPMAASAAEVAVVTFGDSVVKLADFCGVESQRLPPLCASGATPMGRAVCMGLDELEQVKRIYREMGVDYYQPWLVLMTDGSPTDDIGEARFRCSELVRARKLTVFPVAIGADANRDTLRQLSGGLEPLSAGTADFARFFQWLSASVSQVVSTSMPGDGSAASHRIDAFRKMVVSWSEGMNASLEP